MTLQRLCVSLFFLAMVSGCESVRIEHEHPSSQDGKQCVAQCSSVQGKCLDEARWEAEDELRDCEREAREEYYHEMHEYRACLAKARNKKGKDKKEEDSCYEPYERTCSFSTFFDSKRARCEDRYDQCFYHCGGVIRRVVRDKDGKVIQVWERKY